MLNSYRYIYIFFYDQLTAFNKYMTFLCLYQQVIAVPPFEDTAALAPCNHEEADTRMMVHAADAVKSGHRTILILTVDTDVVVLAVWMAQELHEAVDEL